MIQKMITMQNETKWNKRNEAKILFLQTEAKILWNELRFASISHEAKKKFKRKRDTLEKCPALQNLIY
jgi:hypothetical protein